LTPDPDKADNSTNSSGGSNLTLDIGLNYPEEEPYLCGYEGE
jgi:hypothetical protein